ncbi:MAG: XdhC family protein [Tepidisphaeraceae bacterium]
MTRSELLDMIALAERLLNAGEHASLATLFAATGSTFRPLGAMMVSGPGGVSAGGVSGGCVEEYVAREGWQLTRERDAAILGFDSVHPADDNPKPTLGCGGAIDVLVERLTPTHLQFLRQLASAMTADVASSFLCTVDLRDGQVVRVRRRSIDEVEPVLDADERLLLQRSREQQRSIHATIDGATSIVVQHVRPRTRLVILGAGNDVPPLCKLAKSLDWHVAVLDRRARLATAARFAEADQVVAAPWEQCLEQVTFTPHTAIVVMTHSLVDDIELLPLLSPRQWSYLGLLGPQHRRQWVIDGASRERPLDPAFVQRIRGPVGLDLGDRSPAGIAVSIVAEVLAATYRPGRVLRAVEKDR